MEFFCFSVRCSCSLHCPTFLPGTLRQFASPLCHGLTVDSRVPYSGPCTTPACLTDPDLRFSGSATTHLLPPAGSYSNPNHHIHHNCFYDSSPLPLSLFHVGFTTPICYTRHEILSVAGIASRPLPCLAACLRELGIARNVPRRPRRLRRGDRREKRNIPVIVGVGHVLPLDPASPCRQPVSCSPVCDSDVSAASQLDITTTGVRLPLGQICHPLVCDSGDSFISVDTATKITPDPLCYHSHTQQGKLIYIPCENSNKLFTICVFSAQSVGPREKRTEIVNFVRDEDVDMMFLTETWMKTQGDEAECVDLSPPGYTFKSFPRATRGGDSRS